MVLHAVPTSGIIFAVTSASKRALERAAPLAGSPSSQSLLAATVGAFCGIASAHPLDVVKTRLLAQSYAAGSTPYYRGPVRALQQIGVDEGFRVFIADWVWHYPALCRQLPSTSPFLICFGKLFKAHRLQRFLETLQDGSLLQQVQLLAPARLCCYTHWTS